MSICISRSADGRTLLEDTDGRTWERDPETRGYTVPVEPIYVILPGGWRRVIGYRRIDNALAALGV